MPSSPCSFFRFILFILSFVRRCLPCPRQGAGWRALPAAERNHRRRRRRGAGWRAIFAAERNRRSSPCYCRRDAGRRAPSVTERYRRRLPCRRLGAVTRGLASASERNRRAAAATEARVGRALSASECNSRRRRAGRSTSPPPRPGVEMLNPKQFDFDFEELSCASLVIAGLMRTF